jgi:Kef-type K+ transport system membrane component KefB
MRRILVLLALLAFIVSLIAFSHRSEGHGEGHVSVSGFLFAVVAILLAAKIGGELFEMLNQPAVLGELIFGVVLGNLHLVGFMALEPFKHDAMLALFAEIGVILLLFEVGLESDMRSLMAVGASAMLVAALGVLAPIGLGYGVSAWFLPQAAWYAHLFAGATLAATSVGITARVLKDLRKMHTKEARIILGAAVVDDVLGLIILAVVSGIITSIGSGGSAQISLLPVLIIVGKSLVFLVGAVVVGGYVARTVLELGAKAKVGGMAVVLSIAHCFSLAGLAELKGLAPIVGAFASGLVMREEYFSGYTKMKHEKFEEIISPISQILVPVFFVLMGLKVELQSFADLGVLEFAAALSVAAIIGKQICALGVLEKGLNRVAVGVGMIPRGEVGLIFAKIGAGLTVAGHPVFGTEAFSAMVVMVMVTTLATPPLLKLVFAKERGEAGAA